MSQSHYGVPPPSWLRMGAEITAAAVIMVIASVIILGALACSLITGGCDDT